MKYMFMLFSFFILCIPSLFVGSTSTSNNFEPSSFALMQNQSINISSFTPQRMPVSIKRASIQTIGNGQYGLRFFIDNPNNVSIKSLTVALPIINSSKIIKKTIVKKIELINSNEVFVPISTTFNIFTGQSLKVVLVESVVSSQSSNLQQVADTIWEISFDQIPRILIGLNVIAIDGGVDTSPFCSKAYYRGRELCASPILTFTCTTQTNEAAFLCEDSQQE